MSNFGISPLTATLSAMSPNGAIWYESICPIGRLLSRIYNAMSQAFSNLFNRETSGQSPDYSRNRNIAQVIIKPPALLSEKQLNECVEAVRKANDEENDLVIDDIRKISWYCPVSFIMTLRNITNSPNSNCNEITFEDEIKKLLKEGKSYSEIRKYSDDNPQIVVNNNGTECRILDFFNLMIQHQNDETHNRRTC
jgi:hypothetical protein